MIDSKAVRVARENARLSQFDLARAAGVSQQLIAAIETGRTKSTKFLPRIAMAHKRPGELDEEWLWIAMALNKRGELDADRLPFQDQRNTRVPASVGVKDPPAYPLLRAPLGRQRLDNDYAFFASEILRIRTKSCAPLVGASHASAERRWRTPGRCSSQRLGGPARQGTSESAMVIGCARRTRR